MHFYLKSKRIATKRRKYPCVILTADNWDDYSFRTLFNMDYSTSRGVIVNIGQVKIAYDEQKPGRITVLDDYFEVLPENYFSLGQSFSYYKNLNDLGKSLRDQILYALKDMVYRPDLVHEFGNTEVYKYSIARFSEAIEVQQKARSFFYPEGPSKNESKCSFLFEVELKEATIPHRISVVLGNEPRLPDRIMALIGKNGTGKTWLLGRLAAALSGDEVDVGSFSPQRPAFRRVLAVSYSAFDKFNKPTKKRGFSYVYCGVYDKAGKLKSPRSLILKLKTAARRIVEKKRRKVWRDMISAVLDSIISKSLEEFLYEATPKLNRMPTHPELSSGQLVLASTITELVAYIESNSIVLLDEPEMHQHPNSIAGMLFSLNSLLKQFNSYAIIATHSPLVVQQIPSQYVRQFIRTGNATVTRELPNECFGENLSAITEDMFQTRSSPSLYQSWFKENTSILNDDSLIALFPNGLSFNALTTMQTMKPKK